MGLQSVLDVWLQSVVKWITKCVRDYKVWQGGLQSVAGLQSELVQPHYQMPLRYLKILRRLQNFDQKIYMFHTWLKAAD